MRLIFCPSFERFIEPVEAMHLKPICPYRCFPFDPYQCELWRVEDETYQTLSERSFEIRVSSWSTKLPKRLS